MDCAFIDFFSDDLMFASAFDEDPIKNQSLTTKTNKFRSTISGSAVKKTNEGDGSQTFDVLADSYLINVLSRKDGTNTTSHKKKSSPGRAPRRPLVCIPCKKRFTRRSKLDQHNRLVHNTDVRYSCSDCQKTFSRRDHIARHVKNGHCTKQSATGTEPSVDNDDTELLVELSTFIYTLQWRSWVGCVCPL